VELKQLEQMFDFWADNYKKNASKKTMTESEFVNYCIDKMGPFVTVNLKFMADSITYNNMVNIREVEDFDPTLILRTIPPPPSNVLEEDLKHLKISKARASGTISKKITEKLSNLTIYKHLLITPIGKANLVSIVTSERVFSLESYTYRLALRIARAISTLHDKNIMLGNLRMENIIRWHGKLRLFDLEFAQRVSDKEKQRPLSYFGSSYHTAFLPPEMFHRMREEDMKSYNAYWQGDERPPSSRMQKVKIKGREEKGREETIVVKTFRTDENKQPIPFLAASKNTVELATTSVRANTSGTMSLSRSGAMAGLTSPAKPVPSPLKASVNDPTQVSNVPYEFVPASSAIDIWNLGMVFFFLFTGQTFYSPLTDEGELEDWSIFCSDHEGTLTDEKIKKIITGMNEEGYLSDEAKKLLIYILRVDPKDRPSISNIIDQPIFKDANLKSAMSHKVDKMGRTALHKAAEKNDSEKIVSLLTSHEANTQDRKGYTALHMAALKSNHDCVDILLKESNIFLKDEKSRFALQCAIDSRTDTDIKTTSSSDAKKSQFSNSSSRRRSTFHPDSFSATVTSSNIASSSSVDDRKIITISLILLADLPIDENGQEVEGHKYSWFKFVDPGSSLWSSNPDDCIELRKKVVEHVLSSHIKSRSVHKKKKKALEGTAKWETFAEELALAKDEKGRVLLQIADNEVRKMLKSKMYFCGRYGEFLYNSSYVCKLIRLRCNTY
jgi:serine/threonine protein kinase